MSGNVRLLAYAYIGICGAAILAGLYICLGLALSGGPNAGRALGTIGMPFLLLSIVYFIRCREHSSTIDVIHSSIDVPDTPLFPSTPA